MHVNVDMKTAPNKAPKLYRRSLLRRSCLQSNYTFVEELIHLSLPPLTAGFSCFCGAKV